VKAMRSHGLDGEIRVVLCDGEDQLDGQLAARALLEGELPTGVVAFNDDIAAAAMSVLAQQGIDIPGDVSIIGFDDSALARAFDLTSVQQIPHNMARLAVDRIIARTTDTPVPNRELVLEPDLILRSTTGPARPQ
jgi:DNA-binding LacI/PurR family transcriptional regulator